MTQSGRPASIFTIHNLAYQGLFPSEILPSLSVPDGIFTPDGIEFYGKASFLKAGIRFSDRVTTVSPSHAREILAPAHGCGLDGLLRNRINRLSGILNGVDYRIWDPKNDCHLQAHFAPNEMSGKQICKASLQRELGLAIDDRSVAGMAQPNHRSEDGGHRFSCPACNSPTQCSARNARRRGSPARSPISGCSSTLSTA